MRIIQSYLTLGTTSYPIWGRKACPAINGTETVYTGIYIQYIHPLKINFKKISEEN